MTRPDPSRDPGGSGLLWGTGAAVLMVLCCAAPLLIAGGALAGVGGFLGSPWLIGTGVLLLVVALLAMARRNRNGDDSCCPPTRQTDTSADPFDTQDPHDR